MPLKNQREIFGWGMYDWANSAFSTIVVTTFLGPYLTALAEARGGVVNLFGYPLEGAGFYPLCVSISVGLQVFVLPILGAIADYSHLKKRLMLTFAYLGAIATMLLFLVTSDLIWLGGLLFIIANLSFGAALVFYNAFLPDIAGPNERDSVSSKGFALGYVGGGLALLLTLAVLWWVSEENRGLAIRLSLAGAGLWWLVFTFLFPQRRLVQRDPVHQLPHGETYLSHSFKQLGRTIKELFYKYPTTLRFLIAYLIYNDGIQTINTVATIFASSELGLSTSTLVQVVLMIQFVAALGAMFFNFLAGRLGAKKAIMLSLVVWSGLVIYAYGFLYTATQFWILAAFLAMVLGGSQALSRSLFSQMIPKNRESEYFSLYEISERGTSWLGPVVFALALQLTGAQRISIVMLIIFFVVGLILLALTDVKKAITDSGNELPAVV
ncbi:MAG: MFS transporter [Anaerolineae bacterium]|nr:MFS transporter [Anaerolineae bacterium]